jgi:hypothetical protein
MKRVLLFLLVLTLAGGARAQESVTLTSPIIKTSTSSCALETFDLNIPKATIAVTLTCNNGDAIGKVYNSTTTPTGASLISTLNTSNNSTTSLVKRVYNRLIADGVITGTVSGTPQ